MTRNLKALGLALVAVFAFASVAASSALAATDHFTTEHTPTIITGAQVGTAADNLFSIKSFNEPINCAGATFGGTVTGTSNTEVTVHPTYNNCTTANLGTMTVDTTGCNYILKSVTDAFTNTSGAVEGEKGTVSLECEAGKSIKLTLSLGCTITMTAAANQNLLGVKYTNEGSGSTKDVKIDVTIDHIAYTSNFTCQLAGMTASDNDAYLTETVTVKGYTDNAASGPSPNQDSWTGTEEGGQTGIEVS
jgi:hypothetical protein